MSLNATFTDATKDNERGVPCAVMLVDDKEELVDETTAWDRFQELLGQGDPMPAMQFQKAHAALHNVRVNAINEKITKDNAALEKAPPAAPAEHPVHKNREDGLGELIA